jgi:hypothetical protein
VFPACPSLAPDLVGDLGVVLPEQLAGHGIDRAYHVHRAREVQGAVDDQRRRHETDVVGQIQEPVDLEVGYVAGVYLVRRTEAAFVVGAAIGKPVRCLRFVGQGFVVVNDNVSVLVAGRD